MGSARQPIILLTPIQIESWLQFYDSEIEEINAEFVLVPNRQLVITANSTLFAFPNPFLSGVDD